LNLTNAVFGEYSTTCVSAATIEPVVEGNDSTFVAVKVITSKANPTIRITATVLRQPGRRRNTTE
jgi:hypothetical protein